ncbi:Esterase/lipase [Alkalibacterium sp. AK22]|uniref:alpha/beta hydrolase n=1 Tax=Alkalibacterium sp. AK22 TaxID=1229520 RepID=UPI00044905F6|nr:alpha/beta hydrolase [Alkalibacterium sp. AK22]EXJ24480.1 Esterase/lipase [Alkalibacterium sp. AK22]
MTRYSIFKDVRPYKFLAWPLVPVVIPIVNTSLWLARKSLPVSSGVTLKKVLLSTTDDTSVTLYIYSPVDQPASACLLYFYGSAYFMTQSPHHHKWAMTYAKETTSIVVLVDYRQAPRYPFPAPFNDCFQAADWVFNHSRNLGIDPRKIAVGGDSSGGALAAGVTLLRRDRHLPNFCFQFLLYPVMHARTQTPSMRAFDKTPFWNNALYKMMWSLYVQKPIDPVQPYAAPLEARHFRNLPPAYIEVCEYDPLRDEGLLYAKELMAAKTEADVAVVPKALHGYDIPYWTKRSQAFEARRIAALKTVFEDQQSTRYKQ